MRTDNDTEPLLHENSKGTATRPERPRANARTWQEVVHAYQVYRWRSALAVVGCVLVVLIVFNQDPSSTGPLEVTPIGPLAANQLNDHSAATGKPDSCQPDHYAWVPSSLSTLFKDFKSAYNRRPLKVNNGGTGLFHQFGLFAAVRTLKPKCIIESGAHRGLATFMLRAAAPEAKIIVVSPENPDIYRDNKSDTVYFTGDKFQDFNTIQWRDDVRIIPSETLIFFDDHQSGVRRSIEAYERGFRHIVFDDCPIFSDNYNPLQYCILPELIKDVDAEFRNVDILDNFAKVRIPIEQQQKLDEEMGVAACLVEQLTPLWGSKFNDFEWRRAPASLKRDEVTQVLLEKMIPAPFPSAKKVEKFFQDATDLDEPRWYNWMTFVKLCEHP